MRSAFTLLVVAALLYAVPSATGQGADPQRIVLVDGTVLVGNVVDADADPVVIVQDDGTEFRIPQLRIREMGALAAGRFARTDPSGSRLFFAPTARTMGRGNGRLGSYYILPTAAYAPAENVDLQAFATIPIEGESCSGGFDDDFSCDSETVGFVGFSAKNRLYSSDRLSVALGASALLPYGGGSGGNVGGTVFATATLGSETSALTLGVTGFYGGGADVDFEVAEGALFTVGLERQVSNSLKLISENHVAVGGGGAAGGSITGVRFFGDRLSADLALMIGVGEGDVGVAPLPYIGFSYSF
jgi:hypothetical protein